MKARCPRCDQSVEVTEHLVEDHTRKIRTSGRWDLTVRCATSGTHLFVMTPEIDFLKDEGLEHGTPEGLAWGCRCWQCHHMSEEILECHRR